MQQVGDNLQKAAITQSSGVAPENGPNSIHDKQPSVGQGNFASTFAQGQSVTSVAQDQDQDTQSSFPNAYDASLSLFPEEETNSQSFTAQSDGPVISHKSPRQSANSASSSLGNQKSNPVQASNPRV